MRGAPLFSLLLIVTAIGSQAVAQADDEDRNDEDGAADFAAELHYNLTKERLIFAAFDPDTFFDLAARPNITISQVDDWGRPQYSIAVVKGCRESMYEDLEQPDCRDRVTARMVRAPLPPDGEPFSEAGRHLVGRLADQNLADMSDLRRRLTAEGVEWKEAVLSECKGVAEVLEQTDDLQWITRVQGPELLEERDSFEIFVHPYITDVTFEGLARKVTYTGVAAPGTPAEWAGNLYDALDPCWQDFGYPPPWSR